MGRVIVIQDETLYRTILDSLQEGVYLVDSNRRILYWNRAAEVITGFRAEEIVGRHCGENILGHVDAEGRALCLDRCPLVAALEDGSHRTEEIFLHHRHGHLVPITVRIAPITDASGRTTGAIEIFSDNSAQKQLDQRLQELEQQALVDPMTGLPNRRYLEQQLQARIDEHNRYRWPFGVLLLDIDRFKLVNDTYGHDAGDRALRVVARTLGGNARIYDTVGRWGGEEFLAILANVEIGKIVQIADRFRSLVASSHIEASIHVTISIGAAAVTEAETAESIFRRVDGQLYRAKESGRNRVCY
jgi:diguanylate cyclase (GGDEF)-like protein/PAS domain S-box-containing protein